MIYDLVHIDEAEARAAVRGIFYERGHLKDPRIIQHLVDYGYYELEETMLQHKQKHHLYQILQGQVEFPSLSKWLPPKEKLTPEQLEARWIEDL